MSGYFYKKNQIKNHKFMNFTKKIFTLISLLFLTLPLFSQSAKINGYVVDKGNNEPIYDASVKVLDTEFGVMTELDGSFVLNLPKGTYKIEASYITFSPDTIEVKIDDNGEYNLDFSLTTSEQVLQTVVVAANVSNQSSTALVNLFQKSPTIVTGLSAEDIRRTPDRTTSDALKRVSGTSVQDNRFVIVRGLSERYVANLINGMSLPSTEPDRRAFAFDIFPSNLLDNLLIIKTANPNLPGDFAGGVVQLNTREIPDKSFFSINLGSTINSQSTFRPWYHYNGGSTDWMGFDDGTRGLPSGLPTPDTMRARLQNFATRIPLSRRFGNTWAFNLRNSMPMIYNCQISGGFKTKISDQGDFGLVGALTYNNSHRLTTVERRDFNFGDPNALFIYQDSQFVNNVSLGGLLNLSISPNARHRISLNNVLTQTAEDMFVMRDGVNNSEQRFEKANSMQYTQTTFWSSQLLGEHRLNSGSIFNWGLNLGRVNRNVPDFRRMFYTRNFPIDSTDVTTFQAFVPFGQASPSYAGRFYSTQNEKIFGAQLEYQKPYGRNLRNKFSVGLGYQAKNRDFDARVLGYVVSNFSIFNYDLLSETQDLIFDSSNISENGYRLGEITNPSDSYTAMSQLFSPFVMIDQNIGPKFRMTGGLRFELYRQKLSSTNFGGTPIKVDSLFADFLPSINLAYNITEKSKLRFSASRTVNRPNFRELAPFSFFDFNLSTGVVGNDTITPSKIWNYDLRYEIFPGKNQMFAATFFYKSFQNPIEQFTDAGTGGSTRQFTFANVPSAYDLGLEIEARFGFDIDENNLLNLNTNAAYVYSRVDVTGIPNVAETNRPLQGQSPFVLNASLNYQNTKLGFGATVLYNQIGRRIWQVGYVGYNDVWESSRPIMDLQLTQKIGRDGELKLNISDILNQKLNFYQDINENGKFDENVDNSIQEFRFGTNISINLSCKF